LADAISSWPAVVQHGDLYRDNILVHKGALNGVIDWETWHPRGTPGVDLVHLLLLGSTGGGSKLPNLASPPGWPAAVHEGMLRYARALGLAISPSQMTAVGMACWANRLTVLLERPERRGIVTDRTWIRRNVGAVLDGMEPF
jgi:aminoglycoside phosphotransferase (APT) family kinase protein